MESTASSDLLVTHKINGVTVQLKCGKYIDSTFVVSRAAVSAIQMDSLRTLLDPDVPSWIIKFQFEEDQRPGEDWAYVPTYFSLEELGREAKRRDTQARLQKIEEVLQARIDAIAQEHHRFTVRTGYADDQLNELLGYHYRESLESFMGRTQAAERRFAELVSQPLSVVLAEHYARSRMNEDALLALIALSIRSNGYIEMLGEEQLITIYGNRLRGVATLVEARRRNLTIMLEDYAPGSVVKELEATDEPSIKLAPSTIKLLKRDRSLHEFAVGYSLERVQGSLIPTGTVTLSLAQYELNRPVSPSDPLAGLPHGIQLVVVITVDGREVTRGTPGENLDKRIRSYKGGKQRGALAPNGGLIGLSRQGAQLSEEIPPWCMSKRPGRWR